MSLQEQQMQKQIHDNAMADVNYMPVPGSNNDGEQ